jgi:adenosylcobyric acid synthase
MSQLFVVGIGPGGLNHMTFEAHQAIEKAEVVVGYQTYLEFIEPLLKDKQVVSSGMMREVERCSEALAIAASGKLVALVSSGDAGIYGMAGLAMELAEPPADGSPALYADVEVVIVPGVSAVQAAASVLGAPLMHDFAVISLSDLMTPLDTIRRRLKAAASADFVVALYNPRSKGRVTQIEEAAAILIAARGPAVPVGIVRNACRDGEESIVTTLGEMLSHNIDMFSIVIVGNKSTRFSSDGRIITPRGYATKERTKAKGRKGSTNAAEGCVNPVEDPRAVMFCGTGSDVGKSVITAGFCRILKRRGIAVAPFKSQNMALNSAVTPEGGEIGRAQGVQAEACRIPPHTDMNPVLLKPNSETGSQVIVQGRVVSNMGVKEYVAYKPQAFEKVRESFQRLKSRFSFIVMEGAGSIAEINLRSHDIANLSVAAMAGAPAILVADIDRGGVFAQIVGTLELLSPEDKAMIKGVIINKFRGDPSLLDSGIRQVEERTGVPVLGVLPWFSGFSIPEEDSVALQKRDNPQPAGGLPKLRVGVVRLSRISNYTDFSSLEAEADVAVYYTDSKRLIESMDLLIIPGTKSTLADLEYLRETGTFEAISSFQGPIVGICGGYQMLGKQVLDPHQVESELLETAGFGFLDVVTTMLNDKQTHQVEAQLLSAGQEVAPGCEPAITGYEIHMGETVLGSAARPFATVVKRSGGATAIEDGAVSPDGRVFGTYLHGIFDNNGFRTAFLNRIRRGKRMPEQDEVAAMEDPFDLLATHMEQHLDMARIFEICGPSVAKTSEF